MTLCFVYRTSTMAWIVDHFWLRRKVRVYFYFRMGNQNDDVFVCFSLLRFTSKLWPTACVGWCAGSTGKG
jgi:hypothetical protein